MRSVTSDLRNKRESKRRQVDMLTAIGDVEDENEVLRDEVTRLKIITQPNYGATCYNNTLNI